MITVKITPRFSAKEIYDETIGRQWFEFQNQSFMLGQKMATYMSSYINSHRHRRGGTGRLAKSMKFEGFTSAGMISWGIGHIPDLPAYYYVINYGRMVTGEPFVPFKGNFVPGSFEGKRPSSALKGGVERFNIGDGSGIFMKPGSVVRPIHYIEATYARLNANLSALLAKIRLSK